MLIHCLKVRTPNLVPHETQVLEMWNRQGQRLADFPKACITRFFRSPCNTVQKPLTKRIVFESIPSNLFRKFQQLGDQMKISDISKKFRQLPEPCIGRDLLEPGLSQKGTVPDIVIVGAIDYPLPALPNLFS